MPCDTDSGVSPDEGDNAVFKGTAMNEHRFVLRDEYVELYTLLKLLAIADSGGAAKAMVADRMVKVDGQIETRKARKLRAGSTVEVAGQTIRVLAS